MKEQIAMIQIGQKIDDFIDDLEFDAYQNNEIKKIKFSDYEGKWLVHPRQQHLQQRGRNSPQASGREFCEPASRRSLSGELETGQKNAQAGVDLVEKI
jgi:hypothetical protein